MTKTKISKKQRSNHNIKAVAAFLGLAPARDAARADAQVALLLSTLVRVGEDLPSAPPMTAAERGGLMGGLFPHAGSVVARTATTLLRRPARYPDLPGVGAALHEGQRRCDRLWIIENLLFTAAQRCRDARCAEQGKLLKSAIAVAEHVTHAAALRLPDLDHEARRLELAMAGRALHKQRARAIERRQAAGATRAARRGSSSAQQT